MKIYQAIYNWGHGDSPQEFGFLIEQSDGSYSKCCLSYLDFYTPDYVEGDTLIIKLDNPTED